MRHRAKNFAGRWFTLPKYEDEDQAQATHLLVTVVQVMLVALLVFGTAGLLMGNVTTILLTCVMLGVMLATLALAQRGRTQTALVVFAFGMWATLTVVAFRFGGLRSSAFLGLVLATLVTTAMLQGRARWLNVTLMLISFLTLYLAEVKHLLPADWRPPAYDLVIQASLFVIAAVLLHLITRSMNNALRSARSSQQAMQTVLNELTSTTISKTYLDNILRSISDALIVLGPDMRIERVNRTTLDLLGYTEAELIGQTPAPIFPPDALDWLMYTLQVSAVKSIETKFHTRAGAEIPVSFSASPLYDPQRGGQGIGVVCVAQDISERHQAAQELRRREQLYRALARNLPDMGVVLYDHDLRILIAEGPALSIPGYTAHEIEGCLLAEVLPEASFEKQEAIYRAGLRGEHTTQDYTSVVSGRIYHTQAVPLKTEEGHIFAGMMLYQDITMLRHAEEDLKRHLEQLTILRRVDDEVNRKLDVPYVLKLALDMAVRISIARAGAILLLDDEQKSLTIEEMIGHFSDRLLGDYPHQPEGFIKQALETGQTQLECNRAAMPLISNQRPIGVLLLETPSPLAGDQLSFMQVLAARVAVAVDNARLYQISRQQVTELQSLYDRVSELERLKSDMIRIAAHDLRNPLNVVSGFAELMIDSGNLQEREQNQAAHIHHAALRMQRMVSDILSLERIERMQAGSLQQVFDLNELAAQVYEAHRAAASQHEYCFTGPPQPVMVRGDLPQMREAIANLITNALKYTPAGKRVEICLSASSEQALLDVIDSGFGIPDDMQARLFQPFFRARSPETRNIEGTGLGLHLVKNIIERHNGVLRFHSIYGQGSSFGFQLPLAPDTPQPMPADADHEPEAQLQPD
jgi:PAS domain S-box-containing protein